MVTLLIFLISFLCFQLSFGSLRFPALVSRKGTHTRMQLSDKSIMMASEIQHVILNREGDLAKLERARMAFFVQRKYCSWLPTLKDTPVKLHKPVMFTDNLMSVLDTVM